MATANGHFSEVSGREHDYVVVVAVVVECWCLCVSRESSWSWGSALGHDIEHNLPLFALGALASKERRV